MNKEICLVTGASGYLGHKLVSHLLYFHPNIEKVICFDNLTYNQDNLMVFASNPKFQFVYGDVRNQSELLKYVKQATTIFLLAAIVGAPACDLNKQAAEDINFGHVDFVVKNCNPGTKIIYPCTNSIFGSANNGECDENTEKRILSHYADTKYRGGQKVIEYGGISLNLGTVMGFSGRFRRDLLVNSFVLKALTDGYLILSEGNFIRSYVHIIDVISAFLHSLENYDTMKGESYNVSAEDFSKLELCEKIKKYIPNFRVIEDQILIDKDKRNYRINFDKIKKTGWLPAYTLEQTIQELIRGLPVIIHSGLTQYTNL